MGTREDNLKFKSKCLINLDKIDLNTPVYRVFPVERLLQLFNDKKNTLVKPSMWDDPFENVVFQQTAQLINGQTVHFDTIKERYYGQCWTLNTQESDALWRIYSPNKMGVRVKTTLNKLWDSYYDPNYMWAMISFFIGKITYAPEADIKTFFETPENIDGLIFDGSGSGSVQTLLIKRMEFLHENEIRLIYSGNPSHDDLSKPIYQYPIEPNDLLDELLFDPRFDNSLYTASTNEFRRLGFTKTIEKSRLYQLPKFNIRLNH